MKKLKIILLFSLILRFVYIVHFEVYQSKYIDLDKQIEGTIIDYQIKKDKLEMTLRAKEKIKVFYYITSNEKLNYQLGDKVNVWCNLKKPSKNRNDYLFNYQNYLLSQKIYWICETKKITLQSANKKLIYQIKNKIINYINDHPAKEYLELFILGKNNLDEKVTISYQDNGISHLFAISGMHITLFTAVLFFLFKKIKYKKILIFLFLFFYLFLTNYAISVLRSVLLFVILNINLKIKPTKAIGLIALGLLTYNPFLIYNIGFVFSFLVSFTLVFTTFLKEFHHYFVRIFMVSFTAFIVTTPIMIQNFFEINLLSPFINIIFVPIVSFIIFPFSLITFFIPKTSLVFMLLIHFLESLSILVSNISFFKIVLCHMNLWGFLSYYLVIFIILYQCNQKKYSFFLLYFIMILIHFSYPYFKDDYVFHFIDVGQGDSILITLPHNKNILIDTGGKYQVNLTKTVLEPYLHANGISKIDYLILTHGDNDHINETFRLIESFKIKKILMNSGKLNSLEKEIIKRFSNYQLINQYELEIDKIKIWFINKKNEQNENDDSLVAYTKINHTNILLMGDASSKVENDLLNAYNLPKMDILKVGHHGSKYSTSSSFLDVIQPTYAIICSGLNNRYHHPHSETLERLKEKNVKTFITSMNGMIKITIKNHVKISTCL